MLIIHKIKYLISVLLLAAVSLTAQEIEKKGHFSIGIEGGPQITNIKGFAGIYNPVSKVGFYTGVYGDYFISNSFRLRLGAYYDNRRFGLEGYLPYLATPVEGDSTYYSFESYYLYQVDYSLNYLTIPIGIVYAKGNEKFKILIEANFYYSLFLFASRDGVDNFYIYPDHASYFTDLGLGPGNNYYEYTGNAEGFAFNQDNQQFYFNNYDFGFNFMIGAMYFVTERISINAGIGFALSIPNVFQDDRIDSGWSQQTKFNIGVAYLFKKKNHRFGK